MISVLRGHSVSLATAVAIAGLLGGCGGGDATDADTAPSIAGERDTQELVDTIASTAPVTNSTAETAPTTTSPQANEPETTNRPPRYPEIATAEAESGSNPVLSWSLVDGAALYRVVVLDPDGDPYWAWSGADTSVALGGNATSTAVGARVFGEMTWQVAALDGDDVPLAISERGRLSP